MRLGVNEYHDEFLGYRVSTVTLFVSDVTTFSRRLSHTQVHTGR
jgi:hypothetical protein